MRTRIVHRADDITGSYEGRVVLHDQGDVADFRATILAHFFIVVTDSLYSIDLGQGPGQ